MEPTFSIDDFEQIVGEALDSIPDELFAMIENVAIVVENWPTSRQMQSVKLSPGHLLLGLYEGVPLTGRHDYGLVAPDKITIFRGPILQLYHHDAEAIRRQVRHTVIHEIAHHFGISDQRLIELGAY